MKQFLNWLLSDVRFWTKFVSEATSGTNWIWLLMKKIIYQFRQTYSDLPDRNCQILWFLRKYKTFLVFFVFSWSIWFSEIIFLVRQWESNPGWLTPSFCLWSGHLDFTDFVPPQIRNFDSNYSTASTTRCATRGVLRTASPATSNAPSSLMTTAAWWPEDAFRTWPSATRSSSRKVQFGYFCVSVLNLELEQAQSFWAPTKFKLLISGSDIAIQAFLYGLNDWKSGSGIGFIHCEPEIWQGPSGSGPGPFQL